MIIQIDSITSDFQFHLSVSSRKRHRLVSLVQNNLYSIENSEIGMSDTIKFSPFSFDLAITYHLTYHYSIWLHINHLVFLHSYLFGMALLLKFISLPLFWSIALIFTCYCVIVFRWFGLSYVLTILAGIIHFRSHIYTLLIEIVSSSPFYWVCSDPLLFPVAIILLSFSFQLLGHFFFEKYQAEPSLFHGFISAPVLEWCSLLYRLANVLQIQSFGMKANWRNVESHRENLQVLKSTRRFKACKQEEINSH